MDISTEKYAGRLPPVAKPGLKLRLEHKLGLLRKLTILPYRGHGTPSTLQIKGRVIEAAGLEARLAKEGTRLHNALATIRRMRSDEIPGALVRAEFRGRYYDVYTDKEGYFLLNLWLPEGDLKPGWHRIPLHLVDSVSGAKAEAIASSYVPDPNADFAVVSDIDDTVMVSSAFDKLTQIRLTLFKDAASRTPVEGVASVYENLSRGPSGAGSNPFFYLSRTGWNLNDLLEEFIDHHGFPQGPMFLRDLAFRESKSVALGSEHHKIDFIRHLMLTYDRLPMVLIGDSGQHDQEHYWQIAMENPERVKAVYLHDVGRKRRERQVELIRKDLERRGVPLLHASHASTYEAHMREHGLIA